MTVGVRHVANDVDRLHPHELRRQVVALNCGPIVLGADTAIGAWILDSDGYSERLERPVRVLAQVVLSLVSPHDTRSNTDVRKELVLQRGGDLS